MRRYAGKGDKLPQEKELIPTETNMIVIHAERGKPLYIGREGENNARQAVFDMSHWRSVYGPGVTQLLVQRTGEATPYPAALTVDGNRAFWTITAADTAIPGSMGKAELRYIVGDTLVKSETWTTIVLDALGEPSETPPEPYQGWVDQVLAAGADAQNAANRAESAALNPPKLSENQTWMVWNPDTGVYEDTGVYSGGEAPTIGANGNWVIGGKDTGVAATGPAGLTPHIGENGNWYIGEADTGVKAAGSDGATPTIGANGNWYIGTVDTGVKAAGSDGKTPHIGENGNWWIEDTDTGIAAQGKAATVEIVGTETLEAGQDAAVEEVEGSTPQARKYKFKVPQGKQGNPGATPQRGTDYWTAEDQQAIVDDVLAHFTDVSEVGM